MKKLLSIMTAVLLMAISAIGQSPAPGLFNYQGVARNSVGNVLVNKTISLRLTVHDGTPAGPSVYQETRTVTTNPFGLFNVQVGGPGASSSSGTIPGVNWGVNAKYIQVEIDPNGGSTFINIGTAQIASVPYALYSSLSNDLVLPFDKTQADAGTLFKVTNSGTGAGSRGLEGLTNSTAGNVYAVTGTVTSTGPGGFSTGVRGINNGTGGLGIGVWGSQAGSGWGVYGTAPSGIGGNFNSTSGTGVSASSTSGTGLDANSGTGDAVRATTGGPFGKFAVFGNATAGATGVAGNSNSGIAVLGVSGTGPSGIFQNFTAGNTNTTLTAFNQGGSGDAFSSVTTGTGRAGFFQVNNAASGADALTVQTNGAASSWAIRSTSTGAQGAGLFTYNNAGGTANTLRVLNNGSGTSVSALNNGTGVTGDFQSSNAANVANTLNVGSANTTVGSFYTASLFAQRGVPGANNYLFNGNTSIKGVTPGAGIGVQGSSESGYGVTGLSTSGIGVYAASTGSATALRAEVFFGSPTAYALQTAGRVQISGQNAGLNRVLTSDAVGNATWQTLGGGVGIGGSGTLNYVPKWTPDGSNLGNSLLFDNGAAIGLGTTTPNRRFTISHGGGNGLAINSTAGYSVADINAANGDAALRFFNNSAFDWHIGNGVVPGAGGLDIYDFKTAQYRMVIMNGTGRVGVSTTAPNARMHVDGDNAATHTFVNGFVAAPAGIFTQSSAGLPANSGSVSYAEGATTQNTGVSGDAGASAFYNVGGAFTADAVSTNNNIGVFARGRNGATNFAGWFEGRVRVNDGTAAAGRLFVSTDGLGTGNWQTPASAGLVSGSGTLNYIPKWTPNGTTLGNSLALDDNNSINIGNYYGNPNSLNVYTTPGHTNPSLLIGEGNVSGLYLDDATGNLHVTINNTDVEAGTKMMTFDDGSLAVGIGTATPVAKLEVRGYNSANNTFTTPSGFPGATGIAVADATAESGFKSSIYSFADGATGSNLSVWGDAGTTSNIANVGIYGRVSLPPTGTGFSAGLLAMDVVNGPNTWAAVIRGRLQYQDGNEGAGKVLTSDANGNASWQGPVSISGEYLLANLSVPVGTDVVINNWNTILSEDGGPNFNSGTGEYTIPVSGFYDINATVNWLNYSSTARARLNVLINGITQTASVETPSASFGSQNVHYARRLNAGDVVSFMVNHASASNETLGANSYGTNFDIKLVHR